MRDLACPPSEGKREALAVADLLDALAPSGFLEDGDEIEYVRGLTDRIRRVAADPNASAAYLAELVRMGRRYIAAAKALSRRPSAPPPRPPVVDLVREIESRPRGARAQRTRPAALKAATSASSGADDPYPSLFVSQRTCLFLFALTGREFCHLLQANKVPHARVGRRLVARVEDVAAVLDRLAGRSDPAPATVAAPTKATVVALAFGPRKAGRR